jgi:tryptophan synthase beta chain
MKSKGKFGPYGGIFAPETLIPALEELEQAYFKIVKKDKKFNAELNYLLKQYAGRPTPLYYAENLSKKLGCKIYLKREDLLHGGAHKTNNGLGQGLLAKYMGKKRIIAETGAGQHGFATAMIGAFLGIQTEVYMGVEDIKRQKMNVLRMRMCGAKINPVEIRPGVGSLKDAVNEAMRDYITNVRTTYYLIGSVVGPHPYPTLVAEFQRVISKEIKKQSIKQIGKLPSAVIACVGGGSNAIGAFYEFIPHKKVRLIGVEAAGLGVNSGKTGASINKGSDGILHGSLSKILQDKDGQILEAYSISAGLDYPGVGPQHAQLAKSGRAKYTAVTDQEALDAFELLSQTEGIIPALESAHAVAYTVKYAKRCKKDEVIVINLSGRGDKDMEHVSACSPLIRGARGV